VEEEGRKGHGLGRTFCTYQGQRFVNPASEGIMLVQCKDCCHCTLTDGVNMPDVPTLPEFITSMDDDSVSVSPLTRTVNPAVQI